MLSIKIILAPWNAKQKEGETLLHAVETLEWRCLNYTVIKIFPPFLER
jgi:hypothetical protein